MRLTNKNILLVSPEPWGHIFVSKHHYAVELSRKGNSVFYLNPPRKDCRTSGTRFDGVVEVNYSGFPRGLRYYPRIVQRRIMARVFNELEVLCCTHFDLVWSFDNSVFYDFFALPESVLTISHIVDFNQNFRIDRAAATADFCFCTTEAIRRKLCIHNRRVFKINHGYSPPRSKSPERRGFGTLNVAYAGNLAIPSIDWCLLRDVVVSYPDAEFTFIGPNADSLPDDSYNRSAKRQVLESPNARFIGTVESHSLHNYYGAADILLVAYRDEYQADQVANPHKMMEYLGSGAVVLATMTLEFADFYPLIVMSEKNSDWLTLFRKVVSNLGYYNSEELQTRRMEFARQNTYENQINRIEQTLDTA